MLRCTFAFAAVFLATSISFVASSANATPDDKGGDECTYRGWGIWDKNCDGWRLEVVNQSSGWLSTKGSYDLAGSTNVSRPSPAVGPGVTTPFEQWTLGTESSSGGPANMFISYSDGRFPAATGGLDYREIGNYRQWRRFVEIDSNIYGKTTVRCGIYEQRKHRSTGRTNKHYGSGCTTTENPAPESLISVNFSDPIDPPWTKK